VFALGATLYRLLCGFPAHERGDLMRDVPRHPSEVNPIVPPELGHIALRCLEPNPAQRPPSVTDLRHDLIRLGLTGDGANVAPLNLARILLSHLGKEDIEYLAQSLEKRGFRSSSDVPDRRRTDLVEEYCYTATPHEVLAQNCTGRQLATLAQALGCPGDPGGGREELISEILGALGFLAGPRHVPGVETTRAFLEGQTLDAANATTSDECIGLVHSGLAAVERFVDVLVRFYGQMLYGSGFGAFVSRTARGKPADRLTFGEKVHALRELTSSAPSVPVEDRVRQVFRWPLIDAEVLAMLGRLVSERNRLAHRPDMATFHEAQRFSRTVLLVAGEVLERLAQNPYLPRTVQIVARQDDVYGRHFYLGRDDRDHPERIFTPLPLQVGQLYLFYPLTNPARVNPLIFPYEPIARSR
jgi:hypothetical protein